MPEAALAGHAGAGGDVLAGLLLDVELDPLTAVGVDGAGDELVLGQVAQAEALTGLEDDARRPDQLRHDDALGAVDDEGALGGHLGEVPHEDRLLLDLAGVGVDEPGPHEDRCGVGHVPLLALLHRELGRGAQVLVVRVELELELQGLREVLDGRDVAEGVRQTLLEEPVERLTLDGDEVRKREDVRPGSRTNNGPGWWNERTTQAPQQVVITRRIPVARARRFDQPFLRASTLHHGEGRS